MGGSTMKPWEKYKQVEQPVNNQGAKPWERFGGQQSIESPQISPVNGAQAMDDLENTIAMKKATEEQKVDVPTDLAVSQGMYRGLGADLLGAPVDITTMALNAGSGLLNKIPGVNIPSIQKPVGGSDWIAEKASSGAEAVGYPVFDPSQVEGSDKFAYNVARFGSGAGAGGLALAGRAAKAGQAAQNVGKVESALIAPYQQNAGRQVVDDVVAGAGAGAGFDTAENIAPDSPLAQIVGTILGGGGASVGSRVAESGARSVGRGVVKSIPGKGLLPDSVKDNVEFYNQRLPDGSVEPRQTVEDAALMIQKLSTDPKKASQSIKQSIGEADEVNQTRLTSGVASDDVGLGSFENYQRTKNARPFMERDQKIRTDVSESVNNLRNPDADIEAPQRLAKKEAEFQIGEAEGQAKLARKNLSEAELERTNIDRQVEDVTEPFLAQKGRKAEASTALDEQIGPEGALGERTKLKNTKFEEAAGDDVADISPIADSIKKVESEINTLGFENTGLPADFVKKIRKAIPEEIKDTSGGLGIGGKEPKKVKEIKLKDVALVRRDISSAITRAKRAGNFDLVDNLSTLKKDINSMIDETASFDDAQKYYREEYAPFFAEGYGKKYRDTVQRGDGVGVSDPGKIADIFLNGTPNAAADLKRIVDIAPDNNAANNAVERYMAADFASSIGNNPSPRTIANWMKNRSSQLDQFPEIKNKFKDLQRKIGSKELEKDQLKLKIDDLSDEFRKAEKNIDETKRRINRGVFGSLINNDPDRYVKTIMSGDDRLQKIDEVNKLIGKNEQAKEGFKRAVTEDLLQKIEGTDVKSVDNSAGPVLYNKIKKVMDENGEALAKVYSPKEMNALRRSQKILSQYGNLNRRATVGSDTAQKMVNQQYMDAMETFFRIQYGVLKAGGIMRTIKGAARLLPEGRVSKADRLVSRAMLDPEVAVHLLDSKPSQIGTAKWNKKLTQVLAGGAGIRESIDGDDQEKEE